MKIGDSMCCYVLLPCFQNEAPLLNFIGREMIFYDEKPFDVICSGSKKQPTVFSLVWFSPGGKGLSFPRIARKPIPRPARA
jgi:hypothetical protein